MFTFSYLYIYYIELKYFVFLLMNFSEESDNCTAETCLQNILTNLIFNLHLFESMSLSLEKKILNLAKNKEKSNIIIAFTCIIIIITYILTDKCSVFQQKAYIFWKKGRINNLIFCFLNV